MNLYYYGEEQKPLFFIEVKTKRIHDALPVYL